jgi:hypothetical protein
MQCSAVQCRRTVQAVQHSTGRSGQGIWMETWTRAIVRSMEHRTGVGTAYPIVWISGCSILCKVRTLVQYEGTVLYGYSINAQDKRMPGHSIDQIRSTACRFGSPSESRVRPELIYAAPGPNDQGGGCGRGDRAQSTMGEIREEGRIC